MGLTNRIQELLVEVAYHGGFQIYNYVVVAILGSAFYFLIAKLINKHCIVVKQMLCILPGMLTAGIAIVVACYIAVIEKNTTKLKKSQTNSLILCIPVLLAAFQNVYLAIGISHQTALSLQIMLSLHFFLVLIVDLMNAQILFSKVSKIVWLIVIVIIQGNDGLYPNRSYGFSS